MPSSILKPNSRSGDYRLRQHSNVRENRGFSRGVAVQVVEVNDWFRVTDLGDGVTLIEEPFAEDLVSANIWHVRGRERDLVIDAGLGVASLASALPWLFEHDPILILTHAHLDHMGGAHEFADVRVHDPERGDVLAPGPASLSTRTEFEHLDIGDLLPDDGDFPEFLLKALPSQAFDMNAYSLGAVNSPTSVHDGDLIDIGDRWSRVLHLPGHTSGSIALHEADSGLLFTGDVIYEGQLLDSSIGSDRVAYRATMERLLSLDVTCVFAGHGRVLSKLQMREIARAYIASPGM
jgi:glyoxylase-like metal-dependent hydrolase (beta-lactamase superfamily II)